MSSDGNTIVIGALFNDATGASAGHVRIYEWSASAWNQKGVDIDGEAYDDKSGSSVSMSSDGNTIANGAPFNDGATAINAGHVRIYNFCITTQIIDYQTACDTYQWIDGNTYTASNSTATHTLTNAAGCDSVLCYI